VTIGVRAYAALRGCVRSGRSIKLDRAGRVDYALVFLESWTRSNQRSDRSSLQAPPISPGLQAAGAYREPVLARRRIEHRISDPERSLPPPREISPHALAGLALDVTGDRTFGLHGAEHIRARLARRHLLSRRRPRDSRRSARARLTLRGLLDVLRELGRHEPRRITITPRRRTIPIRLASWISFSQRSCASRADDRRGGRPSEGGTHPASRANRAPPEARPYLPRDRTIEFGRRATVEVLHASAGRCCLASSRQGALRDSLSSRA